MNNELFYENKKYEGIEPNNFSNKRFEQIYIDTYYHLYLNERLISNESCFGKTGFPFVSILIITYNKKDVLVKSIRSINNQSLKKIEIIIVNDNSIDKSKVIFQYLIKEDETIRIYNHLKNILV